MIGELRADADSFVTGGQWLATAMQVAWEGAAAVLDVDGLADVLGERHRIMSNDWLAAHMQSLIERMLAQPRRCSSTSISPRPRCAPTWPVPASLRAGCTRWPR